MTEAQPILTIPHLSLVILVGAAGSGKTTFARRHFKPTEVLSSDMCRALVSDDEGDMAASSDAFEVLHLIAAKRLATGRLTIVDATNVQPQARQPLIQLARKYHYVPVAIVLDLPERICQERNRLRSDRTIPAGAVHQQALNLRRSIDALEREGFRRVYRLRTAEQVDAVTVAYTRMAADRTDEHGPFDIIGDVHGCFAELRALLGELGYLAKHTSNAAIGDVFAVHHPQGRKAIFLGDLVDRGPDAPSVLRLVMSMTESGMALCVPGNHDMRLLRNLSGHDVQVTHGLRDTLAQLGREPPVFVERVRVFLDGLVSYYLLDGGRLVVAHAGMKREMQGRESRPIRNFALYGETTGETDEFGLPLRCNWARDYDGTAMVVYGHTPVSQPEWLNRTINIDTGCVFGGRLTALRYPEREFVSVPAARVYYQPVGRTTNAGEQTGEVGLDNATPEWKDSG